MKREMFKDRQIVVAQQNVKEKSFWLNQLSGPLVKSFIPYDFDSGKRFEKEYNVAVLPFEWTGQLFQGLLAQSGNSHYKLHIIMLAGIILLLDKYTGNRDIVVSTPIYRPDIEGKFINSVLPVRIQPGTQNTFKEMLKLVSKTVVEASENQNYPMEILLEQIGMPLIKGEPSLLDTAVVIENVHEPHHIRSLNPGIIFSFLVTDASIKGKIEYHSSLYAETTVERVIVHLKRILAKAAVNLDCPLSDLDIVSEEERYRLLNGFSHAGPGSGDTPAAFAPLPRQRIYIVDGYNHLQPQGLEGDVYFAGANVTGGVEDPFFPGDRMWKTGDIARWLPDGTIEFSGKEENRLIIRGCRIGPEKIEKHLLEIPYIKEAVVTTIETENNTPSLCAYIVSEKDLSASEWKEKLAGKLPDYLIPASLVRLEKMPLTPGGKIDRTSGALLENEARVKTSYISPRDIVEEKLTFIWSEILEMDKDSIRIDDNFSQLGGQSLQAIMMSSRIHKEFNISIPIPEIFELSTLLRFADYIRRTTETEFSPIVPVEKKEYYAISPAQKRLYLLQQIDIGSIGYNDPDIAGVEGSLDSESLEEVFKKLIKRHETLRTSFQIVENAPVQKIHNDIEFEIEYYEGKTEVKAEMEIVESFVRPFDLSQAPLFRVGLIKKDKDRCVLMVDKHHIISDATSRRIFLEELIGLYNKKKLPALKIQYKDYSEWLNTDKQKEILKKQENYWLKRFEGEIPLLNLPTDYPRPAVQVLQGNTISFSISEEETRELERIATEKEATLYMVLLAIYNIFLSKICGQADIVVGTPVVGRRHADLECIMGIFINTLALRNYPEDRKSFKEFLSDVRERALSAFENQMYQFEDLVNQVYIDRDISRNPLFDTMFMLQLTNISNKIETPGLKVIPYGYKPPAAKFDLTLQSAAGEKLYFAFEYNTKLFKEDTIERFILYFKEIISGITANSDIRLKDITISHNLLTAEQDEDEDQMEVEF